MKLSVIIVNYNVEAYLEQCLDSVHTAMSRVDGEVFVVDNLSTDGSLAMIRKRFPQVHLIANQENVGFSRANNQAIKLSKGEYVLLLNPDTVVGEDVFEKVCSYLDKNPEVGGLGVKMIDGTGEFLPESKRGLPTPSVAFYKIIGLTRLFPKSKRFGRYQLGHLPENATSEIEILSGACMFLRSTSLQKVGLLDESFFMYGEDIDLSYRILLGGWKNHYYPEAQIIHYKGESTKKSSINYVLVFYNAMAIFAKKHFSSKGADLVGGLINMAIFLSAIAAIVARFLRKMQLPILDLVVLLSLIVAIKGGVAFGYLLPLGVLTLFVSGLFGAYDKPVSLKNALKGPLICSAVVLGLEYIFKVRLFPDAEITLGLAIASLFISRLVLTVLGPKVHSLRSTRDKRLLTIGGKDEADEASALIWQTNFGLEERFHLEHEDLDDEGDSLLNFIRTQRIDEVIFCGSNIPASRIISFMNRAHGSGAQFKIVSAENKYIIGPNSIESKKDLYMIKDQGIISSASQRSKRILDVTLSLLLLATLPLSILFIKERKHLFANIRQVLAGKKSWVGYPANGTNKRLSFKRPGIIKPAIGNCLNASDEPRTQIIYAKDYHYTTDLRSFLSGFGQLGRA